MAIIRIYAGPDGASHFEEIHPHFEPRGDQSESAELIPGSGIVVRRFEPTRSNPWHHAPGRAAVFTLSGAVDIEIGDGSVRRLGPGDILIAEDLTGQDTPRVRSPNGGIPGSRRSYVCINSSDPFENHDVCRPSSLTLPGAVADKLDNVPPPHDAREGRQGAHVLAPGALGAAGRKVVQQTVAQLGELDAEGRAHARALARTITGAREQSDLFVPLPGRGPAGSDSPGSGARGARAALRRRLARLDAVARAAAGYAAGAAAPPGREEVPWATMAAVLVLARLCEPSSELHIAEDWYRRTALDDLLALPAPLVNDDRCYRALDRLLPHKEALEQHLVTRLGELFALDYELLLYDVTSTYFEGTAARIPLDAARAFRSSWRSSLARRDRLTAVPTPPPPAPARTACPSRGTSSSRW